MAPIPAGIGHGDWFGMSENGPLATTVEDARLMFAVLSDTEAIRPSGNLCVRKVAVSVRSPLVGVGVGRPYANAAREAAELLAGAGHEVRPADPPYPYWLGTAALMHWTASGPSTPRTSTRAGWPGGLGCTPPWGAASWPGYARVSVASNCAAPGAILTEHDVLLAPRHWLGGGRPPHRGTSGAGCAMCWSTPTTRP